MKKRAVLDLMRQEYKRASRFYSGKPKHVLTIRVYLDKFPPTLKLTLNDLESILLDIEKDYKGKIKVLPLNDNNVRIKRDHYPVRVNPDTFSYEVRSREKPTITLHDGNWCITLPGKSELIRVGRQGSLNGELFAILAERWGTFQSVEYVLAKLEERVTDQRTKGDQMPEIIRKHLKEINETLHKGSGRRLTRIGDWPSMVGVIWGHVLWNAVLRMSRRGVLTVGFAGVKKPTSMKKKASK